MDYESKKDETSYWQQRSSAAEVLSQKSIIPNVDVNNRLLDRIFGGTKVDIRPQGGSMRGRIESGQRITLSPVDPKDVRVDDAVVRVPRTPLRRARPTVAVEHPLARLVLSIFGLAQRP